MNKYSNIYTSDSTAARKAIINLNGTNVNKERIDAYKESFDDFSRVEVLAPADDSEIAVVCFVVESELSGNASFFWKLISS